MKFFADACLPRQVVEQLRFAGHHVERAPAGVADEIVLAAALADRRLLLTEDLDFGQLAIREGLPHAGVILVRMPELPPASRATRVLEIVGDQGERLIGAFTVVEAGRIRLHHANGGD